jgi:hypothetical protein
VNDTPERSIDERLDALIQTTELLQAMQKDNLEQFARTAKRVDELTALVATHEQYSRRDYERKCKEKQVSQTPNAKYWQAMFL